MCQCMKVEHIIKYINCLFLIAYTVTCIDFEHFVAISRKILYFTYISADQKYVNPSMVIKLMVTNAPRKSYQLIHHREHI